MTVQSMQPGYLHVNACSIIKSNAPAVPPMFTALPKVYIPQAASLCLTWVLFHLGHMPRFRNPSHSPTHRASYFAQGCFPSCVLLRPLRSEPIVSSEA